MIDIAAELRAAGFSPEALEAMAERAAERAFRRVLEEHELDALLDLHGLARLLGCSAAAAKARVHRDAELAGLAVRVGRSRRWRRREIDIWIAGKQKGSGQ